MPGETGFASSALSPLSVSVRSVSIAPRFPSSLTRVRRLRLALVSHSYPPQSGGVEVVVQRLAEGLSQAGHGVTVYTQTRRGTHKPPRIRMEESGTTVLTFQDVTGTRSFPVAPGMYSGLARSASLYDIVHAHNYHSCALLAAAAATLPGSARLVVSPHFHGDGHSPIARSLHVFYRPVVRRVLLRADAIVCVSAAEADHLRSVFPRLGAKIAVIPNGIDMEAIERAEPYALRRPTVLGVGRLERHKGFAQLIGAMAYLPSVDLMIIGDGPQRSSLLAEIADRCLQDRVTLISRVTTEELHRWQRSAAVFVTLSRHEAFGLAPREALAGGVPVIASDIPAHREMSSSAPGAVELISADAPPYQVARAIDDVIRANRRGAPPSLPTWTDAVKDLQSLYSSLL